jgi:hypothetical protein
MREIILHNILQYYIMYLHVSPGFHKIAVVAISCYFDHWKLWSLVAGWAPKLASWEPFLPTCLARRGRSGQHGYRDLGLVMFVPENHWKSRGTPWNPRKFDGSKQLNHHFCAFWFKFIHVHPCSFSFIFIHVPYLQNRIISEFGICQLIGRLFFSEELYRTLEADNVDLSMAPRPWIDRMNLHWLLSASFKVL